MGDMRKRLVVVLGMHRSGTSAVTRGLRVLGVELGDRLMPPMPGNNDAGFWEDIDLNLLNIAALRALGSEWHYLADPGPACVDLLRRDGHFLRAVELLRQKVAGVPVFGFKDPRVAKLLPFWRQVFDHCHFEVSYVLAVRHPLSVVRSLAKRDGLDAEKSYLLWLGHVIRSLADSAGARRVLVDYDLLMGHPEVELARVAKHLDLSIDAAELHDFRTGFLDAGLRHTRYQRQDLSLDSACPPLVREVYAALLQVASGRADIDGPDLQRAIPVWTTEFERMQTCLTLVDRLDTRVTAAVQALAERDAQIERLRQATAEALADLAERDAQIARLTQATAEALADVAERDAQIASLCQQLDTIYRSNSWWLTEPFRYGRRTLLSPPYRVLRRVMSDIAREMWRGVPVSNENKQKLKAAAFRALPAVFGRTLAYRSWSAFQSAGADFALGDNYPQTGAGDVDYVPRLVAEPPVQPPAKLICFYLPQFHPIPENDAWWGEGFTEWTNVEPARPQFAGHYQPHIAGELGYYSLLDPAVQRRQVELAKLYGIGGFCFHFYWFGGQRLLESPIQSYLDDADLELPFCLCWANENWSRRWDGLDSEILIAQRHSPEDDLAFIEHVARYLRDPRYLTIDGRPLLVVYRPKLLPSATATAARWRHWCRANGIGEIYLACTQSFESANPTEYGFDAAIEFPPNSAAPPDITDSVTPLGDDFGCKVYDWRVFVERSEKYPQPDYTLFRGVCPSWDNTARRKNRGTVFLHNTPALYQRWLENAIRDTQSRHANPDERLIFVNAWNEWAEGAHLEPDARYGFAWLQATRNALTGSAAGAPTAQRKIVLVAHDAHPHGAQWLALNLARTLTADMGFAVDLVCLEGGSLSEEYARWARVWNLAGNSPRGAQARALAKQLWDAGHRHALVNSTVSGGFLATLTEQGIQCLALIHELGGVIEQRNLREQARAIAAQATAVVFPAAEVADSFCAVAPVDPTRRVIRPQGLYKRRPPASERAHHRQQLRQRLAIAVDSQVVLGVGYADQRKGIDLFVAAGLSVAARCPAARWVWVGHWDNDMKALVERQLAAAPTLRDRFIFPGLDFDTDVYYGGADVFAMTSREDPFPSVVLEAMDAGLPVVGFDNAGGFAGLVREAGGELVEMENAVAFGAATAALLEQPERAAAAGAAGARMVAERFSFRRYVFDLLDTLGVGLDRVSVVVPNYNYAHYLAERLGSILAQDYPVFEIIFLDDGSTDASLERARELLAASAVDYRIVENEQNSGSVFRQWQRGVDLATGTHIWIAEADDSCDPQFLGEVRKGFRTPGVVLSYCQSRQIDDGGDLLASDYLDYVADIDPRHWLTAHVIDGPTEAAQSFSIKNVIPNVSGVLFAAEPLRAVLDQHLEQILSHRVAGDWLVYVLLLERGRIAFSPVPANAHRRHRQGVTLGNFNDALLQEIRSMQAFVASRFAVSPVTAAAASAYADRLAEQFALARDK